MKDTIYKSKVTWKKDSTGRLIPHQRVLRIPANKYCFAKPEVTDGQQPDISNTHNGGASSNDGTVAADRTASDSVPDVR